MLYKKKFTKKVTNRIFTGVMAASLAFTTSLSAMPLSMEAFAEIEQSMLEALEAIKLYESEGWLESAYIEWQPIEEATGYEVYYKEEGAADSAYVRLDDTLIRTYPGYMRADALGLRAGNYVMKVVPVIEAELQESLAATTGVMQVEGHTREGYAFHPNSPAGTGSGGYNDDGSVPANAQVLYISKDNVNTIELDVITNSKGTLTSCTGLVDILAKREKGYDKTPLIIRMVGEIKKSDINGLNSNGYLQLKGCYNVTLEGVGEDATVNGWGILVRNAQNVEVRNLGIMLFPDDAISLDTDNRNIWIHNNDIFYGTAGSDKDQAKGDGSCDVKGFSNYVTIAYNHFWDAGKSSLCGMSEKGEFFVTYHHNWFDHSDSRHPRIRVGTVHIYNNYFDGNSKYGVGVTMGSSAFVEANYFRNSKYPMLTSLQGTDIANGNVGTFSKEDGGMIKAYNNEIIGADALVYAHEDSVHFDAYLANTRDEIVPDTYFALAGGSKYNNFDTSDQMYDYTPHDPNEVVEVVTTYAGRVNGRDLKWEFDNAVDDTDYSVNQALMNKIRSYSSSLVAIGGGLGNNGGTVTPDPSPTPSPEPTPPGELGDADFAHNFTTQGDVSDFLSITGNLSTSKGSVTYKGMTLTQCLKLESSTDITFTLIEEATMILVLDNGFNGKVKVNGTNYNAVDGFLEMKLLAGTHSVKKGDTANLFYFELMMENREVPPTGGGEESAPQVDIEHNFTVDGKESEYFNISGNIAKDKGTVIFNDLTLTECLKLESSTTIGFTITEAMTLTLVFNEDFNKNVKINDVRYKATDGLLIVELVAGEYIITKGDTANLYYKIGRAHV